MSRRDGARAPERARGTAAAPLPGGFLRDARDSLWLELERYKHAHEEPPAELKRAYELVRELVEAAKGGAR